MNFFEHQAAARRSSTRMVVLFALAVAGIVLAVDAAVLVLFGGVLGGGGSAGSMAALLLLSTLATLAVIGLGSLYRIASLRGGGEAVALQLGGSRVPEDTTDFNLRRLRNVVEEIAIASGVPMPKLFVLEQESAINAFAAGYAPTDAVVAVTRGALERLNRDELQGVIAHEFSHILNGDMRLNIRLMGVLFGIMMLSIIGQRILVHTRGGRSKEVGAVLALAAVAMAVGGIGLFFGRMIKAGVSRQREMLADASAVQFTRQTTGLAGALKKIAGLHDGSQLADPGQAEEVSHMLFGQGRRYSSLFATHPPLLERIRKLEPSFNPQQLERLTAGWALSPPDGLQEDIALGLAEAGGAPLPPPLPPREGTVTVTAPMVVEQVATPAADDYRRAGDIMDAIPAELRALAAQRDAVMPLLLGLLLDADAGVAALQRSEIVPRLGEAVAQRAFDLRQAHLAELHPMLRLPLASLAFPVLRLRPRPELGAFMDCVHAVVNTDGKVSLFEYCLGRLLETQLVESLDPARHARLGRRKPGNVKQEFATLLAVLAQAGNPSPMDAQRAYLAGLHRILPRDHLPYAPPAEGVRALDAVWGPLDALDPLAKQVMVEAITETISHDNRVSVSEAELLRTVCGVLHCPLPAMLEKG
ncbi:peptidase M48 Ste24p [Pseudoxanthomonas kalamensis DSM 18571]|uniref:M48 family metallopeptidase n=1 Tax=Pseudoxanthomonas kalamensis TaxID=289483 RepID=UPI001390ED90|nr:M48 family metallopeptidase [Pseudoxanthomonas kalamensis]KAF1711296.1 peptidase M48 Ste24p [Pseudoxanthomonas kalamensis DSM 18571]